MRSSLVWLSVAIAATAPAVAAIALARSDSAVVDELRPTESPITARVTVSTFVAEHVGTLTPLVGAAFTAYSAMESGTVTSVDIGVGTTIAGPTTALSVDAVPRTAYVADAPMYRDLQRNDSGDDVRVAQQILAHQGTYAGEIDGTFGRSTRAAVIAFQHALGLPPDGVYRRSWAIWVGPTPFTVDKMQAVVGAPAPTAGQPLMQSAAPLLGFAVTFASPTGHTPSADGLDVVFRGKVIGRVHDSTVVVSDPTMAAALQAEAGAGASEGQPSVGVTLRSAVTEQVVALPPSAVVSDGASTCVLQRAGAAGYQPLPVAVLGGDLGVVRLAPDLPAGTEVLLNPTALRERPTCG